MSDAVPQDPTLYYLDREIAEAEASGVLAYRAARLPSWCPGCGYYGIQTALLRTIKALEIKTHELCVVSGIGCTGRFPFFVKAYGIHTLHGRALPVATGAKLARPELTVLTLTGDGDCLGIGAGHLPHIARRNVDLVCILFDNAIYGLTKGQSSPTTPHEQRTRSHPHGNPDYPLKPVRLALSYGASFVARGFAGEPQDLEVLLREAFLHRGFSFVHVVSPCVTFDKDNYTYENLRQRIVPLPRRHDYTDLNVAMDHAMDPHLYVGLFFKEERPTENDELAAYAKRGGK